LWWTVVRRAGLEESPAPEEEEAERRVIVRHVTMPPSRSCVTCRALG
jgi:hypothetical protein